MACSEQGRGRAHSRLIRRRAVNGVQLAAAPGREREAEAAGRGLELEVGQVGHDDGVHQDRLRRGAQHQLHAARRHLIRYHIFFC